jgi:hypothetical protein
LDHDITDRSAESVVENVEAAQVDKEKRVGCALLSGGFKGDTEVGKGGVGLVGLRARERVFESWSHLKRSLAQRD